MTYTKKQLIDKLMELDVPDETPVSIAYESIYEVEVEELTDIFSKDKTPFTAIILK